MASKQTSMAGRSEHAVGAARRDLLLMGCKAAEHAFHKLCGMLWTAGQNH
jgi:hypothetical protein